MGGWRLKVSTAGPRSVEIFDWRFPTEPRSDLLDIIPPRNQVGWIWLRSALFALEQRFKLYSVVIYPGFGVLYITFVIGTPWVVCTIQYKYTWYELMAGRYTNSQGRYITQSAELSIHVERTVSVRTVPVEGRHRLSGWTARRQPWNVRLNLWEPTGTNRQLEDSDY